MNPLKTAFRGAAFITSLFAVVGSIARLGLHFAVYHKSAWALPVAFLVAVFVALFAVIYAMEKP